jgi:hypothetical protein
MDNHTHESVPESRESGVFWRSGAACVVLAAAVLGGCAGVGSAKSDKDVVAQRAQERWDLLVKNDFAGAYKYLSPGSRAIVTEDAYAGEFRRNFWSGAKVDQVSCSTAEACEVEVWIEYQNRGIKMRTPVHEKWIRQDSNWWFVLER